MLPFKKQYKIGQVTVEKTVQRTSKRVAQLSDEISMLKKSCPCDWSKVPTLDLLSTVFERVD